MTDLLGKAATNISSLELDEDAIARRAMRLRAAHELRSVNSRMFGGGPAASRSRLAKCLWRAAGAPGLIRTADGRVLWTGVQTCGSVHACLGCGARIRATRATEIDHLLKSHLAAGRHATLVTFTLPHKRNDCLEDLWSTLQTVYGKVTSGAAIQKIKKLFGITGFIRSMEVTWTWANGWHVHLHIAVFHDVELSDEVDEGPNSLEEFRLRFMQRWGRFVEEEMGRSIHQVYGVDATPIRDAEGIGDYVSKIHFEMVRGDLKTGRSNKSRTPWEIGLDAYQGDVEAMALWREYVKVSHGRRLLAVSKSLRDEYGSAGTEDMTDQEIAQQGEDGMLEIEFSAELFDAMRALHRPILADVQLGYAHNGIEGITAALADRGFEGVIVEAAESVTFVRMPAGHARQRVRDIADQAVVRRRETTTNPHGPAVDPPTPGERTAAMDAWLATMRTPRPERLSDGSKLRYDPARQPDKWEQMENMLTGKGEDNG